MTQAWFSDERGHVMRRRNAERDEEIATLYYLDGVDQQEIALRYHITSQRVSQIVNSRPFREMRAAWARAGEWG